MKIPTTAHDAQNGDKAKSSFYHRRDDAEQIMKPNERYVKFIAC